MKLIELIESGVSHDDILYHDGWALGMRKCKDLGDAFVYCYPETGKFVEEHISRTGYKRVVLCEKILADDKWHKRKIVTEPVVPKYKIGDRFLLLDLCSENIKMGKTVSKTTFDHPIGEIIAFCYDTKTGNILYTVSTKTGFPLLLNENYLSKLDMVVSQDN